MFYSVIIILFVELLERFSFYGINYTQTSYLTGAYDHNWSADMEAVSASSYVSISVAVAYTTPFIGAFLADSLLGDYMTIFAGALGFYLPGLFLIALTTIPGMLGDQFNINALKLGLLLLWPAGTGIVKSVVNVFGAKQFHPILQSSMIESYYVNFYMCINIGALVGGIVIPLIAQHNVTVAYFLPACVLALGVVIFAMGSPRYVKSKPKGSLFGKKHKSLQPVEDTIPLFVIFRISLLIIPFNIAYSQMATTFIVQGTVMEKGFGWIDAACMNNADAISVLFFGRVIGSYFYPALAQRGIKIPTTYKFAIGSALGALAIAWALVVEYRIHKEYEATSGTISILWQAVSYVLIGAGEIFAVSAAYEVAFTASPPEKKALASAINLFCIGSLPNVVCIMLYHACRRWFTNSRGTASITHLKDYASANVGGYFFILLLISVMGIVINLIPQVREFVESVEERATDLVRTPKTPMRPSRLKRAESIGSVTESPLIHAKRHQAYLKYGSGPVLYKSGSMRAGPSISDKQSKKRSMQKKEISLLYKGEMGAGNASNKYRGEGKLLISGALFKPTKDSVPDIEILQVQSESDPLLRRADSV
jgi:dipeptide/tripeptide permease